jgi:hypothetical protein
MARIAPWWFVPILFLILSVPAAAADEAPPAERIAAGAHTVLVPRYPGWDGVLTVSSGDFFVQCLNQAKSRAWRCDAPGLEGEPWLRHVLTPERQRRLIALKFRPDAEFGNFVARITRKTSIDSLADRLLQVLAEAYGVAPDDVNVKSEWLPALPCHPRLQAGYSRAGSIRTPSWGFAQDATAGCGTRFNAPFDPLNNEDLDAPMPGAPPAGEIDLVARYAQPMADELRRVMEAKKSDKAFAIFAAASAYVQCDYNDDDRRIYCEAASDDAVGASIARILTPERRQKLADAGYNPPGKVMNFWRFFPLDQYELPAIAKALLAVLHDVYGYGGAPDLTVTRESPNVARPL